MASVSLVATRSRSGWQITYSALLTGVLAFFLLLVTKTDNEAQSTFLFADKMKEVIYAKMLEAKKQNHLDWLYVEHAGPKGIKLLIPSKIGRQNFFESGDDQIVSNFYFYLQSLANIINTLKLEKIPIQYDGVIQRLRASGHDLKINVRVEGHSDIMPLGRSSRFRDNWDLSTARAHQVMQFLMNSTEIPSEYFSVSGYGPFHPLVDVNRYDENRRVEIYLDIQVVELGNGTHG